MWAKAIARPGDFDGIDADEGRGQHRAQSDADDFHVAGKQKPPKFVETGVMQRVARVRLRQLQCDLSVYLLRDITLLATLRGS